MESVYCEKEIWCEASRRRRAVMEPETRGAAGAASVFTYCRLLGNSSIITTCQTAADGSAHTSADSLYLLLSHLQMEPSCPPSFHTDSFDTHSRNVSFHHDRRVNDIRRHDDVVQCRWSQILFSYESSLTP
ncbi:Hypothetical protein SMAX5B_001210 [Scophthalmus maximus]|uniref:Uncharacterized protein n=1 Tax=Scophthalmus maximus TaxID=52904 RepID=A0A2U9CYG1_SCOMX|nr:Hypothetical protein SMAX5B_001210 [Scophthalmus maximus]